MEQLHNGKNFAAFTLGGEKTIISENLTAVDWQSFKDRKIGAASYAGKPQVSGRGFLLLVPYEAFTPWSNDAPPLVWRVDQSVVTTQNTHAVPLACPQPEHKNLRPSESDEHYLKKVQQALTMIRAGRFYQINLLRFFSAPSDLPGKDLIQHLSCSPCDFGAVLQTADLHMVSFSPERFVQMDLTTRQITTCPIKGTMPRQKDPTKDRDGREKLWQSPKDDAELSMIIDLMCHDLRALCERGSVRVETSKEIATTPYVYHLFGKISGTLAADLSWQTFLTALCPAGSITGAPKKEVIRAIRELEGRPRGLFMGNLFWIDDTGLVDSSVLIRTAIKTPTDSCWQYAAGSGVVIKSEPHAELAEIDAKCSPLYSALSFRQNSKQHLREVEV